MVVAVQRPRGEEGDLDKVLKGLQVVSGFLNVKDQLGAAERYKAQQERQAQADAMQQERFAMEKERFGLDKSAAERKLAKEERFAKGELTDVEAAQAGFVPAPAGIAASIQLREPRAPGEIGPAAGLARGFITEDEAKDIRRTEREMKLARAKQKMDEKDVQKDIDARTIPGLGVAMTKQDAKDLKQARELKAQFDTRLNQLIDLRTEYGSEVLNEDAIAKGKAISKDLLLKYKDLAKLGVLSQADEAILNAIIPPDPLEATPISAIRGYDPVMTKLTTLQNSVNSDYAAKLKARLDPDYPTQISDNISGVAGDDARQARIKELQAAQNQRATNKTPMMGGR